MDHKVVTFIDMTSEAVEANFNWKWRLASITSEAVIMMDNILL